jgi:hypothetical protein
MTAQQALLNRYRPDLKPKSLYPHFHAAAYDMARETGKEDLACIGEVFRLLAKIAGCDVNAYALGTILGRLHKDGTLLEKLASTVCHVATDQTSIL